MYRPLFARVLDKMGEKYQRTLDSVGVKGIRPFKAKKVQRKLDFFVSGMAGQA